jgi:hypothetical protein
MRRMLILSSMLLLCGGVFFAVYSAYGEATAPPAGADKGMGHGMMNCPMAMMGKTEAEHAAAMRRMGMSENQMLHAKMMMNTQIDPQDPHALLALKDQLKLTDDQVQKLNDLTAKMQQESSSLLTDDQKKMLEPMKGMPGTMMQMHEKMMEMHQKMMHGAPGAMPGAQPPMDR